MSRPSGLGVDSQLAELIEPAAFQGKFDIRAFIEQLSGRQVRLQRADPGDAFEPKPLIRDFEQALAQLTELKEQLDAEHSKSQQAIKQAEVQHARRVKQLDARFAATVNSFQSLDEMIAGAGQSTVEIGRSLELLSSQLGRAQASARVLSTYLALRENDRALNDLSRKKMTVEEAKFVRSLLQVCRDVELKGNNNTTDSLERFTETIERDVLAEFDEAYRQGDLGAMSRCATVLYEFNGGDSVHRAFVNQHDFFFRPEDEFVAHGDLWTALADPDAEPPGLDPSLVVLFREIKRTLKDEFQMMHRIFPKAVTVKSLFLQRIFAQTIQLRLEEVLTYAENTSTLAYLRTLQNTHSLVGALVDTVKNMPSSETEDSQLLITVLDTNEEDLFVPYLESGRYVEKEKKSLSELYSSLLYKFTRFHDARKNQKSTTYFDRMVGKLNTKEDGGRVGGLLRLAGIERKPTVIRNSREPSDVELDLDVSDGELKADYVRRMLKWHAEAVGRCVELSQGEVARDALAFLGVLFDYSLQYLETWLDRALDELIAADSKLEPTFECFSGIRQSSSIARLLFTYVDTVILPLAGSNLSVKRDMTVRIGNNTNRINGKINALVQRTVDATLQWTSMLLSKQQKRDYKAREEDINLSTLQTPTNQQVVTFLRFVGDKAEEYMTGSNKDSFLLEVGVGVQHLLLDHYKRFAVNATGGLVATKDISLYQSCIHGWGLPVLDQRFRLLQELGNLFVVKPENITQLARQGELAKLRPNDIQPYLACRDNGSTQSTYPTNERTAHAPMAYYGM
ncbi:exocyst complex component Sec10-like protein [Protomyces lactucae-debilis]|uniref:Exocyst complex component Sec10-like protein n=1 Tax=Protomyces lactucae-debilis TaxID=2754530 RepID=A0A1Y2FDC9_PROLT|nr:exocyst complex component Sec10-like protein [Protomyces lactucae-debilis]ORY81928.1 exocyst complex component Sec10-like protein [Protomyces lactucae-debilis]